MSVSRRKFVSSVTLAGLAAGLPFSTGKTEAQPVEAPHPLAAPPLNDRLPLKDPWASARYLEQSMFSRSLNTTFKAGLAGSTGVGLELIKVEEVLSPAVKGVAATAGQESFSLIFRGPLRQALAQKTYTLQHERMGRFALFLVPAGQDGKARYYQAIFNRLRPYEPDHPTRRLSPPRRRRRH